MKVLSAANWSSQTQTGGHLSQRKHLTSVCLISVISIFQIVPLVLWDSKIWHRRLLTVREHKSIYNLHWALLHSPHLLHITHYCLFYTETKFWPASNIRNNEKTLTQTDQEEERRMLCQSVSRQNPQWARRHLWPHIITRQIFLVLTAEHCRDWQSVFNEIFT